MEFHYTITGNLASTLVPEILKVAPTIKEARLVRSQHIDLSYMWKDWSAGGVWKPANFGSILNPGFNTTSFLNGLKPALSTLNKRPDAITSTFAGLIALDIEEIVPRFLDLQADHPEQVARMEEDLAQLFPNSPATDNAKVIGYACEQIHALLVREVKALRPKARGVGFYGLPNHRDGSLPTSLAKSVGFTAPCIYQWRTAPVDFRQTIVYDRVGRAKKSSTAPCFPFVCPHFDGTAAEQTPLTTKQFEDQVFGAKECGADGIILWGNVDTVQDLMKWISLLPVVGSVFSRA